MGLIPLLCMLVWFRFHFYTLIASRPLCLGAKISTCVEKKMCFSIHCQIKWFIQVEINFSVGYFSCLVGVFMYAKDWPEMETRFFCYSDFTFNINIRIHNMPLAWLAGALPFWPTPPSPSSPPPLPDLRSNMSTESSVYPDMVAGWRRAKEMVSSRMKGYWDRLNWNRPARHIQGIPSQRRWKEVECALKK